MTWFDQLHARVADEGQRPHVLSSGDGRILIAEHGARILAVESPGVEENLIFHTDATGDGKMSGGDRLWIAPEVAWFWPSLEDARRDPKGTAATPEQIDPGNYQPGKRGGAHSLVNFDVSLRDVRSGNKVAVHAYRNFNAAIRPAMPEGLSWVGFTLENAMDLVNGDAGAVVGCWDILQVPPTGTLICPTVTRADVRSYYDPFGDRHVQVDEECVRFLIDGRHRIKMGLLAEHTTGRMAYYRRLGNGTSSLILRIFAPLPGEPYCDIPRDAPADQRRGGDCLQAYNDDGDAFPRTSFGEMEYHDPCLVVGEGGERRAGTSVTHIFTGPDGVVKQVGERLLGVAVEGIG